MTMDRRQQRQQGAPEMMVHPDQIKQAIAAIEQAIARKRAVTAAVAKLPDFAAEVDSLTADDEGRGSNHYDSTRMFAEAFTADYEHEIAGLERMLGQHREMLKMLESPVVIPMGIGDPRLRS